MICNDAGNITSLHLAACTPNFKIQEHFNDFDDPYVKETVPGLPEVVDGYFALPQKPGLGVTLNEDVIREHPQQQVHFNLFADNWHKRDKKQTRYRRLTMRLVQFISTNEQRQVGRVEENGIALRVLENTSLIYDLALEAGQSSTTLETVVNNHLGEQMVDYKQIISDKRILPPLDHPDPAHMHVSGTGLTHLGSAQARDEMHVKADAGKETPLTDSMRLFQWGVEGGKPQTGQISVQPEWFYKGNGYCVVPPEQALLLPSFGLDGGEEAEVVGLYVIGQEGQVFRAGFALGNEFSDHVMERQSYLYLAHSKLRACSFGPELLVDTLSPDIRGKVRILRNGQEIWAEPFLTGEDNMSYHIANLEHHHFKYNVFRRPGDVHCHFFGTATLSFSAGITPQPDDVFEISAPQFGQPLRNSLQQINKVDTLVTVQQL